VAATELLNPLPPITWAKLSDNFILPNEPVESNLQPLVAAALRKSLELVGLTVKEKKYVSTFTALIPARSPTDHV